MYAVFCGVHIVVLIGVFVLFLLCVRNTTSPAKLSFMLTCFSLFILIFGMYLEMVDSDTTEAAISALRIQYIGMYPFSLSLLYFVGGFPERQDKVDDDVNYDEKNNRIGYEPEDTLANFNA